MSAEATLNTALLAHAPLVVLVANRIDRNKWLPGTPANPVLFPRVTFQRVGTPDKIQPITGVVLARSVSFQVESHSESSVEATDVAEVVEDALVAAIGAFTDVTFRDERAVWDPESELYSQVIECDCLEVA